MTGGDARSRVTTLRLVGLPLNQDAVGVNQKWQKRSELEEHGDVDLATASGKRRERGLQADRSSCEDEVSSYDVPVRLSFVSGFISDFQRITPPPFER